MESRQHHLSFTSEFQPLTLSGGPVSMLISSAFNWAALFGMAVVIGYGLRLGLGLQ